MRAAYDDAVRELRKSVFALRLELPAAIVDDVSRKFERLVQVSQPARDPDPHGNWERT